MENDEKRGGGQGVEADEMARVFNIGVGMAIVVAQEDVEAVTKKLKDRGKR